MELVGCKIQFCRFRKRNCRRQTNCTRRYGTLRAIKSSTVSTAAFRISTRVLIGFAELDSGIIRHAESLMTRLMGKRFLLVSGLLVLVPGYVIWEPCGRVSSREIRIFICPNILLYRTIIMNKFILYKCEKNLFCIN